MQNQLVLTILTPKHRLIKNPPTLEHLTHRYNFFNNEPHVSFLCKHESGKVTTKCLLNLIYREVDEIPNYILPIKNKATYN